MIDSPMVEVAYDSVKNRATARAAGDIVGKMTGCERQRDRERQNGSEARSQVHRLASDRRTLSATAYGDDVGAAFCRAENVQEGPACSRRCYIRM